MKFQKIYFTAIISALLSAPSYAETVENPIGHTLRQFNEMTLRGVGHFEKNMSNIYIPNATSNGMFISKVHGYNKNYNPNSEVEYQITIVRIPKESCVFVLSNNFKINTYVLNSEKYKTKPSPSLCNTVNEMSFIIYSK